MSFEASLKVGDGAYTYYPVSEIEGAAQLPYSLTVLLENALRCGSSRPKRPRPWLSAS